jgi:alpha-amylase/alpha-mannosidase (GH57 family)
MTNKYKSVNAKNIFYNWDPRIFTGYVNKGKTVERSSIVGGYFAIWCDHPDYKSDERIWSETELRMWANASKMWNPEVCTDKSGIQENFTYGDMKYFVKYMDTFPGYAGKPGENATLPEAAEPEAVKSWWQELIPF